MELKIIKSKKQYDECLAWVDWMFDKKIKPYSQQANKLQEALLLIKQYEDANYPIPRIATSNFLRQHRNHL
jgi:HTH-type transcriptional regulator/antitoxin HigA